MSREETMLRAFTEVFRKKLAARPHESKVTISPAEVNVPPADVAPLAAAADRMTAEVTRMLEGLGEERRETAELLSQQLLQVLTERAEPAVNFAEKAFSFHNEIPVPAVTVRTDVAPLAAAVDRMTAEVTRLLEALAEERRETAELLSQLLQVLAERGEKRALTIRHSDGSQSTVEER